MPVGQIGSNFKRQDRFNPYVFIYKILKSNIIFSAPTLSGVDQINKQCNNSNLTNTFKIERSCTHLRGG